MRESVLVGIIRICMGSIFLWAFFDKLVGLGFATKPDHSWLTGTSPTFGFLKFATHGPFKDMFLSLAGNPLVDMLFMAGLFCVGLGLLLGIAAELTTAAGSLLLLLMWLAAFPPANNPFLDEHLIYILLLQLLLTVHSEDSIGLGKLWKKTRFVKKFPIFR